MLPEGWKKISLADAVRQKISYGIVQAGPHVNGGVPYIKSSDVRDDISLASLQRTSTDIHRKYIRSSVHPGDIVFSLRGNIGATCIVPPEISEANLTQGTARISCSQKVYPSFLIQELRTSSCIQQALNLSKGSTFKEISLESLRTLKIILPPLPEQKKIAAILSRWDRAIEGTEKLLANSQQQKKALMQQLLTGKKRLPGFTGEWKNYKLYVVGNITTGNTPSTKDESLYGEKFLFITPVDLGSCKYVKKSERMLSEKGASISRMIPAGSIFFSCIGTIGKMGIATRDCITNQQINAIEVKKNHNNEFIYYQIFSNKEQIDKLTAKQAVPIINKKTFSNFIISSPSLPEQKAIAAVLSTTDEEIAAIESDLSRLRQEKKALMQQLLTGKRRVKVD
ncbi:restriction endonuclease subunit S [Acetobacter fabarum]|uniref:restriction endonuclease subunit S n=1 Tax=Acetobacter fabarum TaxID=483199 RepID=UPI00312B6829